MQPRYEAMPLAARCLRVGPSTTPAPSRLRFGPRVPAPYLMSPCVVEPYARTNVVPSAARVAVPRRETHHLCSRIENHAGNSFEYLNKSPSICCSIRTKAVTHRRLAPFTFRASRIMGDDVDREPNGSGESPFPLTAVDKWILSQTDEEFKLHDWEDLRQIIGENHLEHQSHVAQR